MNKKKVSSSKKGNKSNSTGALKDIHALRISIDTSRDQLAKLYKKGMITTNNDLGAMKKMIAKAKQQVTKAKKGKVKKPKVHEAALSQLQSLQEKFAGLKTEMATLKTDFAQFNAQQKMSLKVAKDASKKKPITKKKTSKKQTKNRTDNADADAPEMTSLLV